MVNNCKYTALELLKGAGIKDAEKKIGKSKITIDGISIKDMNHIIRVVLATKESVVIVDKDIFKLKFDAGKDLVVSAGAKVVIQTRGKTKKAVKAK